MIEKGNPAQTVDLISYLLKNNRTLLVEGRLFFYGLDDFKSNDQH